YLCLLQASRLDDLRLKLENESFVNISYIVVNHQGKHSQLRYEILRSKVSEHIPVYQQEENQADVWSLLKGSKDDFLIYDRCGRLVQHLGLPYTFLSFPYVEEAIKDAYCGKKCGHCKHKISEDEDVCKKPDEPVEQPAEEPVDKPKQNHIKHKGHGHRHEQQEDVLVVEEGSQHANHRKRHRHHHHHHHQGVDVVEVVYRPHTHGHHSRAGHGELVDKIGEVVPQREVVFVSHKEESGKTTNM
uniref:Selenoprotein P n=1 Tax=Leptobrachium leishanense TaxID=445787 RepID=A0A8C5LX80_9ANUR